MKKWTRIGKIIILEYSKENRSKVLTYNSKSSLFSALTLAKWALDLKDLSLLPEVSEDDNE